LSETEQQRQERALRELEGKNIAHYSVLLSAWIQTKMERDKTLVTLSSAAIGLLTTILTTVGVENIWVILFFIIAVCSFIVTIWSSLVIYQLNSKHLEDALKGSSEADPKLEKYDKLSFVIGAIAAMLIGASSAFFNLTTKESKKMANKEQNDSNKSEVVSSNESFNGIGGLNPENIIQKSFNGITTLSPEALEQNTSQGSSSQDNNQSQEQNSTDTSDNND
jgi:hypothetical protein